MTIDQRFQHYKSAPTNWDPVKGGKRGPVCFKDEKVVDLGADPTGEGFTRLSGEMMAGSYYPPDAVQFHGPFRERGRLEVGDRVLQAAPVISFLGWPMAWSMVEIWRAEQTPTHCAIGYVTTTKHHGRGIWQAELNLTDGRLQLRIKGTACPNSVWFWIGLPVARYLQLRAWRRGIENARAILSRSGLESTQ